MCLLVYIYTASLLNWLTIASYIRGVRSDKETIIGNICEEHQPGNDKLIFFSPPSWNWLYTNHRTLKQPIAYLERACCITLYYRLLTGEERRYSYSVSLQRNSKFSWKVYKSLHYFFSRRDGFDSIGWLSRYKCWIYYLIETVSIDEMTWIYHSQWEQSTLPVTSWGFKFRSVFFFCFWDFFFVNVLFLIVIVDVFHCCQRNLEIWAICCYKITVWV